MTIESVDVGKRQPPNVDEPRYAYSYGKSMAGDVVKIDFGRGEQDIPMVFSTSSVTTTIKNNLETALSTKAWQTVTVVCDSGDDLGYGASGTVTDLIYVGNSFRAVWKYGAQWEVSLTLQKLT